MIWILHIPNPKEDHHVELVWRESSIQCMPLIIGYEWSTPIQIKRTKNNGEHFAKKFLVHFDWLARVLLVVNGEHNCEIIMGNTVVAQ